MMMATPMFVSQATCTSIQDSLFLHVVLNLGTYYIDPYMILVPGTGTCWSILDARTIHVH